LVVLACSPARSINSVSSIASWGSRPRQQRCASYVLVCMKFLQPVLSIPLHRLITPALLLAPLVSLLGGRQEPTSKKHCHLVLLDFKIGATDSVACARRNAPTVHHWVSRGCRGAPCQNNSHLLQVLRSGSTFPLLHRMSARREHTRSLKLA